MQSFDPESTPGSAPVASEAITRVSGIQALSLEQLRHCVEIARTDLATTGAPQSNSGLSQAFLLLGMSIGDLQRDIERQTLTVDAARVMKNQLAFRLDSGLRSAGLEDILSEHYRMPPSPLAALAGPCLAQAEVTSNDPKLGELAIWWTSESDYNVIERMDSQPQLPDYLAKQFRSRCGRAGRGRLWMSEEIELKKIEWDSKNPNAQIIDRDSRGGIVLHRADAELVRKLPGFVTDLQLNRL